MNTKPTHLPSLIHELLQHLARLWELVVVPGEVAFAIRVFNIQPDEVIRDVILIKALVYRTHILLVIVVPAALVVG